MVQNESTRPKKNVWAPMCSILFFLETYSIYKLSTEKFFLKKVKHLEKMHLIFASCLCNSFTLMKLLHILQL